MAFTDQAQRPPDPRAIAIVGSIHVVIGAALVFGLAGPIATLIEDPPFVARDFPTKPVEPPPPPKPVDQPNTDNTIIRPVPAPAPPFRFENDADFTVEDVVLPPMDDIIVDPRFGTDDGITVEPRPIVTPKPKPMFTATGPIAKNDPGTWASTQDYPRVDLREGNEGVTRFILSIGANGRVSGCRVTSSSGFASLDKATCNLVSRRARFNAAKDTSGAKVSGSYASSIRWVIPK